MVSLGACIPGKKGPAAPPPPPKPVPLTLTVQSSATVNPGESGRATPIVVRVYQLKSDVGFFAVPYEKLFDDAKGALGQDLIDSTSVTLRPSDQTTLSLMIAGDAKFVGIAAFYRQYDNIKWRIAQPAPVKGQAIVLVDKGSITFTAK